MIAPTLVPILRKRRIAEDATEVTLDVSGVGFSFKAGQYMRVTVPGLEKYPLTDQFHEFSIIGQSQNPSAISFAYRESPSVFKSTLRKLPVGSRVILEGPFGIFTLPQLSGRLHFVAGGMGVTPFVSMVQQAREDQMIDIYYFSHRLRAAYLAELFKLTMEHPFLTLHHHHHSFDEKLFIQPHEGQWYIAGPPAFVGRVRSALQNCGILKTNIRTEEFRGYSGR